MATIENPSNTNNCTAQVGNATNPPCRKGQTLISFRPNRAFRGEFGFDWLRVDDSPVASQVPSEPPYKDIIIGSHHSGYTASKANSAAYEDLKKEYELIPISDRSTPLNEYYVPFLNLFADDVVQQLNQQHRDKLKSKGKPEINLPLLPSSLAELRLIVNVQGQKPEKIEVEFDSQFVTINGQSTTLNIPIDKTFVPDAKNRELKLTLKIKCIKGNSAAQDIKVWSYYSGQRSFSGKLKLLANSYADIKKQSMVFVSITTPNIKDPRTPLIGKPLPKETILMYQGLYQALIMPDIEEVNLDLTSDIKFQTGTPNSFVNTTNRLKASAQLDCLNYLKQKIISINTNKDTYPLFFLGNFGERSAGFAILAQKVGVMLESREDATMVHEGLHGMALHHTHMDYKFDPTTAQPVNPLDDIKKQPNMKFIFFYALPIANHPDFMGFEKGTTNIMSYKKMVADERFDLWKWQWDILRKVAK